MKLYESSEVIRLSGLTNSQLREWCGRRSIYSPTKPAKGSGVIAMYTWHDVICLRLLLVLHNDFGVVLSDWSPSIRKLRKMLNGLPFQSMWGKNVFFTDKNSVLISSSQSNGGLSSGLSISLAPHLSVISADNQPVHEQRNLLLLASVGKTST